MVDFVDGLSVSDEERAKLRALGAKTPMAVLSLRKAATQAFDAHFGAERAAAIVSQLERLLSDAERKTLSQPVQPGGALGARIEPPPQDQGRK